MSRKRKWYTIHRTYEDDELFLDKEAEMAVEQEDEGWLARVRKEDRMQYEVE